VSGLRKEGMQFHTHVVVSRHDKTMKNPRNKLSLSPLANQKEGQLHNGASVGFNRKEFAQTTEKVFDQKFSYDRPKEKSFEHYNNQKNGSAALSKGKAPAQQFLMKHTGINEIKKNISPVQDIKKALGIANIPTSLPKGIVDVAFKITKKILSQGYEM